MELTLVATYDEEDGGFRFTRTRSKKKTQQQVAPLIPEAVPEEEQHVRDETKSDAVETTTTTDDNNARPRRRRSARKGGGVDEEPRKAPEERRSPQASQANDRLQDQVPRKISERRPFNSSTVDGLLHEQDPRKTSERRPLNPSTADALLHEQDLRDQLPPSTQPVEVVTVDDTQKIALPFSDTPVIKRNKEFRQQGRKGNHRRSSTGWRGRRASSLIENGSDGGLDLLSCVDWRSVGVRADDSVVD